MVLYTIDSIKGFEGVYFSEEIVTQNTRKAFVCVELMSFLITISSYFW